jgi:hypothetical protein
MTFPNSCSNAYVCVLAGIAALELSCGAAHTPSSIVAPSAPPASQSVDAAPEQPTRPDEQKPPQDTPRVATLEETVKLVARRDLWPLAPDRAEELLNRIGPIHREQPMDQALSLLGGPGESVARIQVSYSGDENGGWTYSVANFYFGAKDLHQLYEAIEKLLNEHLGPPEWAERNAELPSTEWDLGGSMKLLFAPSPNNGEKLLVLSIAEPEGEPD